MASATDGPAVRLADEQVVVDALVASPLDGVPFHHSSHEVERLAPQDFPFHLAVHRISADGPPARPYVDVHLHPAGEVNVLLGAEGALEYDFAIGDRRLRATSPAVVWLPAGTPHAATVARGSGTFVCAILAPSTSAFGPVAVDASPDCDEPTVTTSEHGPGDCFEVDGGAGGTIAIVVPHEGPDGHVGVWVPPGAVHQDTVVDGRVTVVRIGLTGRAAAARG